MDDASSREAGTAEYLFCRLSEITDETKDESLSAFRIAMVIAFAHDELDDVRQAIYTDHLPIDKTILQNAFDYFSGTGICKFETSSPDSEFFQFGEKDRQNASAMYTDTMLRVLDFRSQE